jgi:hypothetical protein
MTTGIIHQYRKQYSLSFWGKIPMMHNQMGQKKYSKSISPKKIGALYNRLKFILKSSIRFDKKSELVAEMISDLITGNLCIRVSACTLTGNVTLPRVISCRN